ncbi:glycosyltransferase family 39 protein [Anaeromyxobacter diazotrophicus]|uniref:Glycosyltransferase RgtA/B/C/D-like domain-containing protein n=1 Tax=Anaeromyxobacter diazotrophicus TaxID=2590199 RepID=A0A7I9VHW4_9BACT|nr:glycosyltransferase family 39 protein [Anaeromyxobacter diazotrophicus]GEJ55935.1 hypothetical protein AMYX_06760 [Anaeromyxobacter diazotrophicus]
MKHPVPTSGAAGLSGYGWALAAAAAALALHLACGNRYGVFRDELYFLACGRHLAWGYVDQPPLIAVVARGASALFGTSPIGLRLPAYAAHAGTVLAAAALARRLGGGRFAVGLAALATLGAPALLGVGHLLTMNAFDPLLFTALALAAARAVDGAPRAWLAAGALVGVGLLNKYSMAFWAVALLAGLAAGSARRRLATPWLAAGLALAAALALPNLLWQARHGFPMLELLRNGQLEKNAPFTWRGFLGETLLEQNPAAAPLWLGGLAWLLLSGGGTRRWLGVAFLAMAAELGALGGKAYYLAPAFPVLWAAGGCAAERALRGVAGRAAAVAALAGTAALVAPLAIPILPLPQLAAWQARLGVKPDVGERAETGRLPQLYADQVGWPELAEAVARAWRAVPGDLRPRTALFAANYGEAGALDLYGPALGLPPCSSGHNSYWLWGPPSPEPAALLVVGGRAEELRRRCRRFEQLGETPDSSWNMPYERRRPIWLCAEPLAPLRELWPGLKRFI